MVPAHSGDKLRLGLNLLLWGEQLLGHQRSRDVVGPAVEVGFTFGDERDTCSPPHHTCPALLMSKRRVPPLQGDCPDWFAGDRVGSPGGTFGAHTWRVLGKWGALVSKCCGLGGTRVRTWLAVRVSGTGRQQPHGVTDGGRGLQTLCVVAESGLLMVWDICSCPAGLCSGLEACVCREAPSLQHRGKPSFPPWPPPKLPVPDSCLHVSWRT